MSIQEQQAPDERVRGFTLIEVAIVIAILAILISIPVLNVAGCTARWENSGMQSRWSFLSQCQVSKDGKTWMPERSYRSITNE
jgi:prepilin-type N-terminal cleavage/methylation domain-containing protein